MFCALLCICAWLAVPIGDISITMQTFGIFLCLWLLGGKLGTICVLLYLIMGAVGLPVFSHFQGGLGVLLGPTGGYIWGFGILALWYWIFHKPMGSTVALITGLLLCYLAGSLWYVFVYAKDALGLGAALIKCVLPYVIPDFLKLSLAISLGKQLKNHLNFH